MPPSKTPETVAIPATVNDDKSDETAVTLLNVSSPLLSWYLRISPTSTPENSLPGLVTVEPLTLTSLIPFPSFFLLRTVSAVNAGNPLPEDAETDLISLIPLTVKLDTVNGESIPLITICSLVTKVPDV
jgi:hypothetical protein